jgi:hypothetical protein
MESRSSDPPHVDEVWDDWKRLINMTAREIENWLETPASQAAAYAATRDQVAGRHPGHRVAEILRTRKVDLTDAEVTHMREVVSHVRGRLPLRPPGNVKDTRWRYSLMNWGHDPVKG